jgi:hypothetical protein
VGGTGSIMFSYCGSIIDGSSGALVGYLCGHRMCNVGSPLGLVRWISLGPGWAGIPAWVIVCGSCGGNHDHAQMILSPGGRVLMIACHG